MDTTIPVKSVMIVVSSSTGTAGYAAQVNGKYFAAKVPVPQGPNNISVIATDQNNAQHQANATVFVNLPTTNVNLFASPNAGIPTFKQQSGQITLDVALGATASIQQNVASYSWDFSGSGSDDLTCYSNSNVSASYVQTGLYVTQVAVSDNAGNRYTDTAIVNVLDYASSNTYFKLIWDAMKNALKVGNTSEALNIIVSSSRQKYSDAFTALQANISQIANEMQDIELVYAGETVAKARIRKNHMVNGQYKTITYYIYFVRDQYGQWKIDEF